MKRFVLIMLLALMCASAAPAAPKKLPDSQITVYVGAKSRRYHYEDCRTLRGKKHAITLAQAKKQGLTACGVCNPVNLN